MNRRNFFQTLFATAVAIFLPKSKKAEGVKKSLSDGLVKAWVFDEGSGSNNDVTVDFYAAGEDNWRYYDGPYYKGWIVTHPKHPGFIIKETQNG